MILKKLIDLILYSNLWIGLCAAAMCLQTQYILNNKVEWNWLVGLIFLSTLFLYALHRIVGFKKIKNFKNIERYAVISNYRSHIIIYAVLAGIGAGVCFLKLSLQIQLSLFIPALISLGYAIPFVSGKKRLRDFNYIKIFLIAIVWSWVTVLLPAIEIDKIWTPEIWMVAAERSLFIFAICLPFDIRDMEIDKAGKVKTIPAVFGFQKTKLIGAVVLTLSFIASLLLWQSTFYNVYVLLGLFVSNLIAYSLLHFSNKIKHDYFFSGAVDGIMLFQFLLIIFFEKT